MKVSVNPILRQAIVVQSPCPGSHSAVSCLNATRHYLQPLIRFVIARGRLPDDAELEEAITLREMFGSLSRAFKVVQSVIGREQWAALQRERAQDLLVYLALERFSGRPRFSVLPRELQLDEGLFRDLYAGL